MLIFDAHLDLSANATEWNRDLTLSVAELRTGERSMTDHVARGHGTVALPDMRRGGVGMCVATQIARVVTDPNNPLPGWRSPAQAWAMTQAQRAWYAAMEDAGEMRLVHDVASLNEIAAAWTDALADSPAGTDDTNRRRLPVGFVLSLEGADSLITLDHLHRAHAYGLRAVGPAHYGPGIYAHGTDAEGNLPAAGRDLLREMDSLGMILDVTHLTDEAFWEAIELYAGPIWASHQNCRGLVPHQRQFSDEQLKALIGRGAVIGAAMDAWMLAPGWVRGETTPQSAGVTLRTVVDHIDHVCQLAGNADHAGIGSDLDGFFGTEQSPADLDTIADLARIPDLLRERGYEPAAIANLAHGNFLRFLREAWA